MSQEHEETIEMLSYNRAMDCYEIRIQVPGELFRRRLIKEIEENLALDLTDPATHAALVARIGNINAWIGRPHVKVLPPLKAEEHKSDLPPKVGGAPEEGNADSLEDTLRTKARGLPPYRWEEVLLTPLSDELSRYEKGPIYRARHREHRILDQLRAEWQQGAFVLDEEAARQERDHEAQNTAHLNVKLETVKEAVNGSRFH